MQSRLKNIACRLAEDRCGNIAMLFALVLVPVIGIVSLSIDYGRALKTKSLISNAADAALHGILGIVTAERGEVERRIRVTLDANLPEDLRGLPFTLSIDEQARTVQLNTQTVVPTAIMALIGVSKMDVAVTSTVTWPEPKAPAFDPGPLMAGQPAPADAARAVEQLARELGQGGRGGTGAAGLPALTPGDIESARETLRQNPEIQRVQAELEGRMRDAMAKMRR